LGASYQRVISNLLWVSCAITCRPSGVVSYCDFELANHRAVWRLIDKSFGGPELQLMCLDLDCNGGGCETMDMKGYCTTGGLRIIPIANPTQTTSKWGKLLVYGLFAKMVMRVQASWGVLTSFLLDHRCVALWVDEVTELTN